ncbi:hypothetical protein [Mycolicibacterium fortuitum]|uniref:hypothetical protein n=1 Tax=Mycolicibacterium fortuitum TaxID=1766 RepID=UPI002604E082|nr:hypothetical protein [Mycolicibacterium fortuitum]
MNSSASAHWSTTAAYGVLFLFVLVAILLAGRMVRAGGASRRRKAARQKALGLLRAERPSDVDRWFGEDWEWAYRHVGTPEALGMADALARLNDGSVKRPDAADGDDPDQLDLAASAADRSGPWWIWAMIAFGFGVSAVAIAADTSLGGMRHFATLMMALLCAVAAHSAYTSVGHRNEAPEQGPAIEPLPQVDTAHWPATPAAERSAAAVEAMLASIGDDPAKFDQLCEQLIDGIASCHNEFESDSHDRGNTTLASKNEGRTL